MARATAIGEALRGAGISDVLDDTTTRALYSSDASLYRVPPQAVVRPREIDEVATVLEVCRRHGVPFTSRGGGTSVAGNAVGPGVVLDFSRHLGRVLQIDPEARTATVQPGVVQSELQRAAAPYGLRFGPDPSTHNRCTVGGMIGNNACGARTLGYGRTSDNVLGLEVLTGAGRHLSLPDDAPVLESLRRLVLDHLATIRTEFGRFGRQASGYALEHLLPENGFDVLRFLVGSEGTLGVVTEATVRLVADPAVRVLVALGYPDIATAGDAAHALLGFTPTACEGLDSRIVDVVRARRGPAAVPPLPRGAAWLFVELSGDDAGEVLARASSLEHAVSAVDSLIVTDPGKAAQLWRIREDGAGLSGRSPAGLPAHSGWEDAAVPPERVGEYLREFESLLTRYGVTGYPYGHFADGCIHIRLDVPLEIPGIFREFLFAAGELVASFGGSMSGEHGDGRARSELLPLMYSPTALRLFGAVKAVFDPEGLLNPGVLVDPVPSDRDLRVPAAQRVQDGLAFRYTGDGGDFTQAVHRCTGVGKCRADTAGLGGVMCPSYLATREEKDSTRGRARVLQEMLNGTLVTGSWRSPEVHEALELCLACKGCASDCPTGVDMATFKSEVLHQSYQGRVRPVTHYTLGRLPRWATLASRAPRAVNALGKVPGVAAAGLTLAGVDRRRRVPEFAPRTFRRWFADTAAERRTDGEPVLLFVDTFTEYFTPEVAIAAVRVLEAAGRRVCVTDRQQCCGLTWITTGQLDAARKILGRTLSALFPAGMPIVGLEPSCTAVLRSDAVELLGFEPARVVAESTVTLAELLGDWEPPSLSGTTVVAQPHCHHHAVMGWGADAALLRRAGATVTRLGGCCGLAGNFGVVPGHYDVSVAVAGHQLLPAIAAAGTDDVVLADGYSCRTQIADLTDRRGVHLAQLLASRL
ncbi:FAD-binding protein [Rhodococcus aetherivorans]|uniref:FAD-binding and (Fe-S)-binding domain-containing protein n=1 Tax=Rhodococcus aetherivorans TaxID=191292 RepID=UPI0002D22FCF|nr:FAD-binding and (Fe-S)-binding domain-containing protein [Rhodococcus aetherivorans]KDE10486.1 oxidoreductase [Rhodococcus aetherivorans]CCW10525.1 Fe-S protein, homolog of lactate dehydrogenase SO1521 [Rhodococcus aetherivorans]